MKITQTSEAIRTQLRPGEGDAHTASARTDPGTATRPDVEQLQLSAEGQRLAAAARERPDGRVRTEKVEEVRRAIRAGEFHVSAHVVAERMIGEAAELIESLTMGGQR